MARVTSKLQFTVPKAIAIQYKLRPGIDLAVLPAGDSIRLVPPWAGRDAMDTRARLRLFDLGTERELQRGRRKLGRGSAREAGGRGWTRESLYERGRSR